MLPRPDHRGRRPATPRTVRVPLRTGSLERRQPLEAVSTAVSPVLRGGALALLAAILFGLSTPLVQRFGLGLGAFSTAALLYGGAALVALLQRRGSQAEAPLRRSDMPRLLAMVATGAVLGPVALAWGLQRTSGASASLLLTLEAVFTAVLAWRWYGEVLDGRVKTAVALLLAGGALLVIDQGLSGEVQLLGLLAVAAATVAWGVDNTLSRGVADRDPGQVVLAKAALGASVTSVLALFWGEPLPPLPAALGLLAVGATGYGLSLRCYLLAQRSFGAARTGSVFAFAPFIGALGAFALGERSASGWLLTGGALMVAGVLMHLAEDHSHEHAHPALDHEHAHTHADGHHDHAHEVMPEGSHSHAHHHSPLRHSHPHAPDAHHQHRH
jgi:drug/metabolite transporter (DMT)-like permease